jgi:hypothetical protein
MRLRVREAAVAFMLAFAPAAFAGEAVNTTGDNVAIGGYDPVAYHVAGRAMQGDPAIRHEWHDAVWQFSSAENRARFMSEPDRYAPRFGGYCAGGVSLGRLSEIDPEEWVIVDGQLFLGGSSGATAYLMEAPGERIAAAEENWKTLGQVD